MSANDDLKARLEAALENPNMSDAIKLAGEAMNLDRLTQMAFWIIAIQVFGDFVRSQEDPKAYFANLRERALKRPPGSEPPEGLNEEIERMLAQFGPR